MRLRSLTILVVMLAVLAPEYGEPQSATVECLGDVGQIALPAVAAASAWIQVDREGFRQLFKAYALEIGAVTVLKRAVDRRRPDGGRFSFPSGHTANAFFGATFLHRRYGWKFGAPAYLAAVFVGYSRIHSNRHWTTDVLAGAAVGISANLVFTRRKGTIVVRPFAGSDGISCMISIGW
jgi:membrane-associated phospholipid phosphatase